MNIYRHRTNDLLLGTLSNDYGTVYGDRKYFSPPRVNAPSSRSKCRFLIKSKFTFFHSFSRLLKVAYCDICRQTHRGKKFVFVCLRPNKTWSWAFLRSRRAVMVKKRLIKIIRCTCKVADLLIKLIGWPYCASRMRRRSCQAVVSSTLLKYLNAFYVLKERQCIFETESQDVRSIRILSFFGHPWKFLKDVINHKHFMTQGF